MYSNSRMKLSALKKLLFTLALICFSFGTIDAQATCGGTGSSASNPFDNPIGCTWTNFTSPLTNYAVSNEGIINGTVNSTTNGAINNTGTISSISNSGTISANGLSANGILNNNLITNIINTDTGTISGGGAGIRNPYLATISSISNSGTISGTNSSSDGYGIYNVGGTINLITNTGIISGAKDGIRNASATITTLNNGQGGTSSPLTFSGTLPTNYNVIVTAPTGSYGQLQQGTLLIVTSSSTVFGISALSATGAGVLGTYSAVLKNIRPTMLGLSPTATSILNAVSNGYSYNLIETGSGTNIWDLTILSTPMPVPTGPSTANTQASMQNTAQVLQGTYTLQNSVLANSFAYDCTLFDKNNICVSAGGRNTAVSATNGLNNTSALLIAAYRPHPNYRIGAYADQNLSVNNAGSTVSLGNNTPLVGLFGAWNERLDGTGTEVKVTAAYGQKNTTVTRGVVGTGATASEAGAGGSNLNSQGAQAVVKYGFGVAENVIVSPYAGIRYTQNNMGGYTEGSSSSVTAPLTYSALNTNATTALAGVGASYRFIPQATAFASAGVETDTNTANGSYSATGVTGLTPINFNANPVKTRPTATLGAYYDVEKNQRLGITGIYRQEPYQAVQTTTVMATYTVGL